MEIKNLELKKILINQLNYINLGHSNAMNKLARIYEDGDEFGIKQDIHKSIELYERAINLGNSDAMFDLAVIHQHGNDEFGIKKDIDKTIELYEKSIKLGNLNGVITLTKIF